MFINRVIFRSLNYEKKIENLTIRNKKNTFFF